MKSIFILGASTLQIPAIKKAKEKGLFTYVLDYDNKAQGIRYADVYLEISTIDKDSVYRAALQYKPDYIVTSTSDMPVRTVSWVCEQLGMKTDISYEDSIYATDKAYMRNRMKERGVPIPQFYEITCLDEFIQVYKYMPDRFILKPTDNSASRGVILIDKRDGLDNMDLEKYYKYSMLYSRRGSLLVEEFMEGNEISVEAFSVCGEPHIVALTDKLVTRPPYFVELGHSQPSLLCKKKVDAVVDVAIAAIKAIGMKDGPTHTEIKITPEGVKLVEIAARLGGDFITSKLVPLSTGIDMIDCCFASLLGEEIKLNRKLDRGAAIRFIQGEEGILENILGVEEVKEMPGIQEIVIYKKNDERISELRNSSDRLGHIIATGKDSQEASHNADKAMERIQLKVK